MLCHLGCNDGPGQARDQQASRDKTDYTCYQNRKAMTSLPSSAACSTIFVCLSINSVYFVSSSTSIHGIYTLCGKAAVRSAPVVSSRSSVCVERVCCQLGFIRIHAFSRIIDFGSLQLLTQQHLCLVSSWSSQTRTYWQEAVKPWARHYQFKCYPDSVIHYDWLTSADISWGLRPGACLAADSNKYHSGGWPTSLVETRDMPMYGDSIFNAGFRCGPGMPDSFERRRVILDSKLVRKADWSLDIESSQPLFPAILKPVIL